MAFSIPLNSWVGRLSTSFTGGNHLFAESYEIARIKQYLGLGFVVCFFASTYLWFKAWNLNFSDDAATCLTRGGQGCLETSNPVWTAGTLKWLAPLMMVLSVLGLFIFALMKNYLPTLVAAFFYVMGMVYLALNYEIKDKSGWTSRLMNGLTPLDLLSIF